MNQQQKVLLTSALLAACVFVSGANAKDVTVHVHGISNNTYTSVTTNPDGTTNVTISVVSQGTYGVATGTDSYTISATGALVGKGVRRTPDGSTYEVQFSGQFVNVTDAQGTWTSNNGTGRFEGATGSGRWVSRQWPNGLGSRSISDGTNTYDRSGR